MYDHVLRLAILCNLGTGTTRHKCISEISKLQLLIKKYFLLHVDQKVFVLYIVSSLSYLPWSVKTEIDYKLFTIGPLYQNSLWCTKLLWYSIQAPRRISARFWDMPLKDFFLFLVADTNTCTANNKRACCVRYSIMPLIPILPNSTKFLFRVYRNI